MTSSSRGSIRSAYRLRTAWNAAKDIVAPWWSENSKEAYASGCANLSTALGNRKAGRARMPRFTSRHRARPTCRFTTGAFGLGADRRHVKLPVIGAVRTAESTRKLARKVEAGIARIRSATLSYQRGRWHVAFSVEVDEPAPAPSEGRRTGGARPEPVPTASTLEWRTSAAMTPTSSPPGWSASTTCS